MKTNKPQIIEHVESESDNAVAGIILAFMFFVFVTFFAVLVVFASAWN